MRAAAVKKCSALFICALFSFVVRLLLRYAIRQVNSGLTEVHLWGNAIKQEGDVAINRARASNERLKILQ